MNAFLLILPILFIRFGLLGMINKNALGRASFFAPLKGREKTAYIFYQISNTLITFFPLFLKIKIEKPFFFIRLIIYFLGVILLVISAVHFARPKTNGINTNGIYQLSRNPMYIGYFVYFLGCVALTRSWVLLVLVAVFQISAHWIILSEERWCVNEFGEEYLSYMVKVRRYI